MQKTLSVVNLSAIRSNALYVRSLIGKRFFYAVVKADAYGHGAEIVSRALEDIVDGFCVAIADEGAALRIGGITKPVLVLAPPLGKDDADKINFYGLQASVGDTHSAYLARECACHVAINTGMNRYGCCAEGLEEVLSVIPENALVGAYSHMYAAENAVESRRQLSAFKEALSRVRAHSPNALAHFSASGGILRGGDYLQDGVRCGLMLYGYAPAGFSAEGLKPALKVYARRAQRTVVTGGGVGYNIADKKYDRLCTYRLGYADGFMRGVPLGEKTLCMDAFISERDCELLPVMTDAQAYAERCGTISYEALCSVTRRSQIVYEW